MTQISALWTLLPPGDSKCSVKFWLLLTCTVGEFIVFTPQKIKRIGKKIVQVKHLAQCVAYVKHLIQFQSGTWNCATHLCVLENWMNDCLLFHFSPALRLYSVYPQSSVTVFLDRKIVGFRKRVNICDPKPDLPPNSHVIMGKVLKSAGFLCGSHRI